MHEVKRPGYSGQENLLLSEPISSNTHRSQSNKFFNSYDAGYLDTRKSRLMTRLSYEAEKKTVYAKQIPAENLGEHAKKSSCEVKTSTPRHHT